jgi:hypothetical protein
MWGKIPGIYTRAICPGAKSLWWGRWDLNPDQRVSSTQGATLRELMGHRSSYSSPDQQTR